MFLGDVYQLARAVRRMLQIVYMWLLWLAFWQSVRCWAVIMEGGGVLKMERASVPRQPLSCFRGLLCRFSLPPSQTSSWYQLWTRTGEGRSPELSLRSCRQEQRRDKLLCLGFIIHSLGDTWLRRLQPGMSCCSLLGLLQVGIYPQLTATNSF